MNFDFFSNKKKFPNLSHHCLVFFSFSVFFLGKLFYVKKQQQKADCLFFFLVLLLVVFIRFFFWILTRNEKMKITSGNHHHLNWVWFLSGWLMFMMDPFTVQWHIEFFFALIFILYFNNNVTHTYRYCCGGLYLWTAFKKKENSFFSRHLNFMINDDDKTKKKISTWIENDDDERKKFYHFFFFWFSKFFITHTHNNFETLNCILNEEIEF